MIVEADHKMIVEADHKMIVEADHKTKLCNYNKELP